MKKNLANSLQAAVILVALIVSSSIGYCQTTAGSLAGDVVDAQRAAISGAVVTATEREQTAIQGQPLSY